MSNRIQVKKTHNLINYICLSLFYNYKFMSNRIQVKKTHNLINYMSIIVLQLQVHLYSFICHLQVVSHGTIAYIHGRLRDKHAFMFVVVSNSLSLL